MNYLKYIFSFAFVLLSKFLFAQDLLNGKPWYDTDGKLINAHGAGILLHNNTYYWFGEFKGEGKTGNLAFDGISCYSSKDLINWKNEGMALKVVNDTLSLLQSGCIIERPKVIYNKKTKKFVLWFHHELKGMGYKAALTGVAIATKPEGPYTYIKSLRPNKQKWPVNFPVEQQIPIDSPLVIIKDSTWKQKVIDGILLKRDFNGGQMSRDMTLYVDNNTAYHIASSEDNQTLHISKLNKDYTDFTGEYYRALPGQANEAPAIFKYKKKYYLFTSGTTGWAPNPGRSFVANKIIGTWQSLGNPVGGSFEEQSTTFKSQSTFILPISKNKFIYMGDRWVGNNLATSTYVWLPIIFENMKPIIHWKEKWKGE